MPIDRTWFNTLVDDDGSGQTGTIWNKFQVDGLLDSIDASNRSNYWTPAIVGNGTAAHAQQTGIYGIANNLICYAAFNLVLGRGTLTGTTKLTLPIVVSAGWPSPLGAVSFSYFAGLASPVSMISGYLPAASAQWAELVYLPPGGGTGIAFLDASFLPPGGGANLIGSIVYLI